MTQYAEVTVLDGATVVSVYNNSATAIAAGYGVLYETVSGKARAVVLPTNGGGVDRTAGVTVTQIDANGYGLVCVHGPAKMYAHEAIATGVAVQIYDVTAHLGEALTAVTNATHYNLGTCMQASGADGDLFEVMVNPHVVTKSA